MIYDRLWPLCQTFPQQRNGRGTLVGLTVVCTGVWTLALVGCSVEEANTEIPSRNWERTTVPPSQNSVKTSRDSKDVTIEERNDAKMLGKAWFNAIKADDFNAIAELFISNSDLDRLMDGTVSNKEASLGDLRKRLEIQINEDLDESYRLLRAMADRAKIKWSTAEIVKVELYQSRFDKTFQTPYFKGMTIVFADTSNTGEKFAVELGHGIQIGDRWYFTRIWENRLVRWDLPSYAE